MILQILKLTKTYPRHNGTVNAVDDLSLNIPKGSFVTVTGASGSGKSTLLLLLGGLLRPTSGSLIFNNTSLNLYEEKDMALFRSNHIGFVMQNFALIPYLTAAENIMIALNVKNHNKADNRKQAITLLESVGLDDRTTHYPRELSAGQQQRVAIARALANKPDILLADEQTANLDPGLSDEILNILKSINQNQGTTVIMVTHSPVAAAYGSMQIKLNNGKFI